MTRMKAHFVATIVLSWAPRGRAVPATRWRRPNGQRTTCFFPPTRAQRGTLQPGDIVSTDKGLFLFRGRSGADGQTADFVPVLRAKSVIGSECMRAPQIHNDQCGSNGCMREFAIVR